MMNAEYFQLHQRIQAFCIGEPNAELPFSRRLAKEDQWTIEYAQRVIEEFDTLRAEATEILGSMTRLAQAGVSQPE